MTSPLGLDAEQLVSCVSCGLCLPHCPTYRVTGLELASPRGRIAAMRAVESGRAALDAVFVQAMEECIQCRGCEAACPSSVPFGSLMETTRAALAESAGTHRRTVRRARGRLERIAFGRVLTWSWFLRCLGWLIWAAQRARVVPTRLGATLPRVSARELRAQHLIGRGGAPDVWLFTGCVMDAWQRDTHIAAERVLAAASVRASRPNRGGECCGALAVHAGERAVAQRLAARVMASMPGSSPILVDSAGCGAALKDYGHLVGTDDAHAFAARVFDVCEWLAAQPPLPTLATARRVVVQDPCHLRHVQRAHLGVRTVLAPAYTLIEPNDDGLCCGAGGAYSMTQPGLSSQVRERKADALRAVGAMDGGVVVASANPGCRIALEASGFTVRHPIELLAAALQEDRQ